MASQLNPDIYTTLHRQTFTSGRSALPYLSAHPCGEKIAYIADELFYKMALVETSGVYLVGKGCSNIESNDFNLIVLGSNYDMDETKKKIESLCLPLVDNDKIIYVDELQFLRGFTKENQITNLIFRQPSMPLYGNEPPTGEIITQKRVINAFFDQDSTTWQPIVDDREYRFERNYREVWDSIYFRQIMSFYDEGFKTVRDFKIYFKGVVAQIENMVVNKADFLNGRLCVPTFIFRKIESNKPVYKLVPKSLNINPAAKKANIAYEIETV